MSTAVRTRSGALRAEVPARAAEVAWLLLWTTRGQAEVAVHRKMVFTEGMEI